MYTIKFKFGYYCFKTAFKYYIDVSRPYKDICGGAGLLGYIQ